MEKVDFINPTPATISVAGEGEVLAVPDIGEFSFSVEASADDVTVAQEESGTKVNAILAYLAEQGIAETDIKHKIIIYIHGTGMKSAFAQLVPRTVHQESEWQMGLK